MSEALSGSDPFRSLLRAASRLGVYVFYGRPGSFKTLTGLVLASMWRSRAFYVGLGKHAFYDSGRISQLGLKFYGVVSFREELETLLELGTLVNEGDLIVYDGFGSLIFPLYAYPKGHVIYSAGTLVVSLLSKLSIDKRTTVIIVSGEGTEGRPLLFSVLRAYVRRYFWFVREGELVRIFVKDAELSQVGTLRLDAGEVLEKAQRRGITKGL